MGTSSGIGSDSLLERFFVRMIQAVRHLVLHEEQGRAITETVAKNNLGQRNLSWFLDTGAQNITSLQGIPLNGTEMVFIVTEASYDGVGQSIATVNSTGFNDSSGTVVIG